MTALLFMKAGMARPQASFAEENAEGLTSRPVPACIPATDVSEGGLQMTDVFAPALINKEIFSRFSLMTRAVIKVANESVGVESFDCDQNLVSLINVSLSI